jgi:hypothetical protein
MMTSLGIIKLNGKIYGYEASFDETSQKWYGEISDRSGKTIHITEPIYENYQTAIQAAGMWIKNDLTLPGNKNTQPISPRQHK